MLRPTSPPDSNLPRIDAVVLRYDATARTTTLKVLQGTPASKPSAPAISRTELVYDLCLCQISRPAGQTALTAANLTDTRTDEALCGLMRDGVTGIPMEEPASRVWEITDAYRGDGWGQNTRESVQEVLDFPRREGIFIENVYNSKVLVGMKDWVASGRVTGPVCYLHTGGLGSLFAQY